MFKNVFKTARQYIGRAYNTAKLFTSGKSVIRAIGDVARDISTQYPPTVRTTLTQYGTQRITNIKLCKEVVSENTEFLLKALAGKDTWEQAKRNNGFDRFYHLFMIATLDSGQQLHIEKNEIMRVSTNPRPCPDSLDLGPPRTGMTVNQMMERTRQRIGDNAFFTYDALQNNCQSFIGNLLTTLGSYTQPARGFVFQDIAGLRSELPSYTKYIARGLTDVGAFFNTGLQKIKNYIDTGTGDQPIIDVAEPSTQ
jgi:hypothetical protein